MTTQTKKYTTTMCLENRHDLCDGDLRHGNYKFSDGTIPNKCQCLCHTNKNLTRQQKYEVRVNAFTENKTFQYLTTIKVKRGDIKCDACGSKLVKELRLMVDEKYNFYLIGINCHELLYKEHKMFHWFNIRHTEAQQIAERLISERINTNNQFYPLQCMDCGCGIGEGDTIRFGHRCEDCWLENCHE